MSDRHGVGEHGKRERRPGAVERALVAPGAPTSLLGALRDPVVVILLLAGFFDGISGNPIHAVVLGSVALLLARDPTRDAPMHPQKPNGTLDSRTGIARILAAGIALLYAVTVGAFGRYSWPATTAVILPGLAAMTLAWRGSLAGSPSPVRPSRFGALVWAGAFVALALWELAMLLLQPSLTTDSHAHPTISVLSDPALAAHPGRSSILFVWLVAGWFLVRR